MTDPLLGIHHVTAIAGDAQQNLDFYTHLLGMRFVKLTVNFDDPGAYHFYFGDQVATPGTLLTFFPHPGGLKGERGAGQATAVAFAIPEGTLDAWIDLFAQHAVDFSLGEDRFGERMICLDDPDGLRLEFIETAAANSIDGKSYGLISDEAAIRGIHSVTLTVGSLDAATRFYTERMGFALEAETSERRRLRVGTGVGSIVDIVESRERGRVAVGSVHHVAFRTPDDAGQAIWRERAMSLQLATSPVMERDYFRSIYFREPSGVLFEVATDGPGMDVDEPMESLGESLRLPAMYEPHRDQIEKRLPPLVLPRRRS